MIQIILFFIFIVFFYFFKGRKYGSLFFPIIIISFWWYTPGSGNFFPGVYSISTIEIFLYTGLFYVAFYKVNFTHKTQKYLFIKYSFIVLFLLGLVGLMFLSNDKKFGSLYLRNAILIPLLTIILFVKIINSQKKLIFFVKILSYSTLVFVILLLINYYFSSFHFNLFDRLDLNIRLGGIPSIPFNFITYYSAVPLASSLSLIFVFLMPFSIHNLLVKRKINYLLFLLLTILAIFLTGTRGAWIALAISLLTTLAIYPSLKNKLIIIFSFLILTVFTYLLADYFSNQMIDDRIDSFSNINQDVNYIKRLEYIQISTDGILKNFWGIGFGRENRLITNEHNMFAFIGLGTGIIGLLLFVIILFYFLRVTYWGIKHSVGDLQLISLGGFGMVVCIIINGMSDAILMESFQSNSTSIILALSLASVNIISKKRQILTNNINLRYQNNC